LGGSDIGSVLGVNPYKSKRKLALQKLGLEPEDEENAAMQRGSALEPIVATLFQEKTGIKVVVENKVLVHPDHPWMLGNVDRWTNPGSPETGILEIKCPGMAMFSKIRREGLPPHMITQLQWYMGLTGTKNGFFAIFNSELWKLEHFEVQSDPELIELMTAEAEKFWTDLQNGIVPEENSGPVIDLLPTVQTGELIKIESEEWNLAVREYREAEEILSEAQELKDGAKGELIKLMGESLIAEGGGVRIYNKFQNGRISIDSKRLKKALPEVHAKYAKTGAPFQTFRMFNLREEY